jgi:hypothetical protein
MCGSIAVTALPQPQLPRIHPILSWWFLHVVFIIIIMARCVCWKFSEKLINLSPTISTNATISINAIIFRQKFCYLQFLISSGVFP